MRTMMSVVILGIFLFVISGFITPAQATTYSSSSSLQFASIARALESIQHLLDMIKSQALNGSPYLAQVAGSTSCPSGYYYMSYSSGGGGYCVSNTSSSSCQPTGGGTIYTCPANTTTPATTYSSCSSSLIALLGDGCHQMYTDSAGVLVYCDGPMTKSAKPSDTATTPGCSSPGGTTTVTSTPYSSCSSSLTNLLGTGCHSMYTDSIGVIIYCDGPMTKSAKPSDTATTPGCSSPGGTTTTTNTTTTYSSCTAPLINLLGSGCHWMYTDTYCDGPMTKSAKSSDTTTTPGCSYPGGTTTTTTTTSGGLTASVSAGNVMLNWTDFYSGESEYRIERRVGTGAWTQIGTIASLSGGTGTYQDTAAASGTYDYHVKPCSTTGCYGESNIMSVTVGGSSTSTVAPTTATPAPIIGNIVVSSLTTNSATIGWTTDISANSKVEYGIGTPSNAISNGVFTTNHTIYLSGLIGSTTYTYNVISENQDYYRTTFSNKTFSTLSSGNVTTATNTSCDSSLIALLGDGCHQMYTDSTGNTIFCDGPMTKSAKRGDTVTSGGCSSPSGNTNTGGGCYAIVSQSSCTASAGCGWLIGSGFNYCDVKSSYAGDTNSCPGFAYSKWDASGKRYCQMNQVRACQYIYPDYLDTTKYNTSSCPAQDTTTTTTTTNTSCDAPLIALLGDGCHQMYTNSTGNQIYCDGPMTKSAKRGDTTTMSGCSYGGNTTTTTTSSSCTASLINLLGSGCHWMYTDTYCDGPMTKSAKSSDTTTTPGCSFGGGTTMNTTTSNTSCDAPLIALLGDGCHQMYTDSAGNTIFCDGPMTKSAKRGNTVTSGGCSSPAGNNSGGGCYANVSQSSCTASAGCGWLIGSGFNYCDVKSSYAGDTNSCPGFAYSKWDASGKRYCQMNQVRACQYIYPDYLDTTKYNTSSCPAQDGGNIATTTSSGVPAAPGGLNATLQANGSVNLVWNDYTTSESEYRMEWRNSSGVWIVIGTTPPVFGGTGLYTDRPSSGRTHEYRVKACNAIGCSSESNIATITISQAGPGPVIATLSPGAGSIGTRVTITGTGFTATGNRINFDKGVIMDIPSSADGTTLIFTVPDDRVPLCAVTDPRCLLPAPYNLVTPGVYPVSVTNANGVSGTFSFSVIERVASVFAVDLAGTFPKPGQTAVETSVRIKVKFSKEFDSASMAQEFFRITKDTAPTVRLNGTFAIAPDGFEFAAGQELEPNMSYTYTVLGTLKDKSGMALSPFTASFTTGSGAGRLGGTIIGKVNDSDGKAVARATVYVFSYQNSFWRIVETDTSGSFQASVPAGNYFIEIHPPFADVNLNRATPREIKILGGETQNQVFVLDRTVKIINGTVSFSNGGPVTDAEVGAYASETKQWENITVDANGRYTLKVGGGTWFVGLHPRDADRTTWFWNEPPRRVVFSKDQNSETKTTDFVVQVNNTTITVTTVDDAGAVLANTGVVIDSGRFVQSVSSSFGFIPPEFRITDSSGKAVFTLRPGIYFVRGYLPSDRNYFNPDEQQVAVAGGDGKEIKMVFRRKQQTRTSMIRGVTSLEQGIPVDAFVWAWSERGGFVSARSDENGVFSVSVLPNDRWHIGAGKEYKGFSYKSTELAIDVKNDPVTVEMVLTKQDTTPLPPTVSVTQTAQTQVVAQATDGAQMTLPPASAASSSTVQLEINPTADAPTQAGTKVMSTVYDVSVRDSTGKNITTLSHEAELIIPYSEQELKDQGVSEDAIVPSFFDEKTGTWVKIDNYTIDKERNVIIARVDHLTRFAITAAADITPPSAPTGSSAQSSNGGKITITWKNPTKDFDYVKVYRSLKEGELGIVRGATIRGAQFIDEEGISDNSAYYYTIRAVDLAGNESTNTIQTRIVASGTSGRAPASSVPTRQAGVLSRALRRGMKGDDVKLLQSALTIDGVYTDEASGFFGKLTENAVIRFQEKYAAEILRPSGLAKGSGIVGSGTRKKISEILSR